MSADSKSKAEPVADPSAAVGQFWAQWMEQSARGTQALLEAMHGATDPDLWQKRWLTAMEEFFEDFLRSPSYLESMRRSLKTITDAKIAQDQMVHGVARQLGLPLAADISGLFDRLHGTENAILKRLEAIENRLEAIEASLGQPNDGPGPNPQPKAKSRTDDDHDREDHDHGHGNGTVARRRSGGGRGKSTRDS